MTEWWVDLQTHVLCFDQINFIGGVGMPLVINGRNDLWFPTFLIMMHGREVMLASFWPAGCSGEVRSAKEGVFHSKKKSHTLRDT